MKEALKPLFTWICSLFNVGVYLADGVDSLVAQLRSLELENQANKIVLLYQNLEFYEYGRFVMMLISVLVLLIANVDSLYEACCWLGQQVRLIPTRWRQLKTFSYNKWQQFKNLF